MPMGSLRILHGRLLERRHRLANELHLVTLGQPRHGFRGGQRQLEVAAAPAALRAVEMKSIRIHQRS